VSFMPPVHAQYDPYGINSAQSHMICSKSEALDWWGVADIPSDSALTDTLNSTEGIATISQSFKLINKAGGKSSAAGTFSLFLVSWVWLTAFSLFLFRSLRRPQTDRPHTNVYTSVTYKVLLRLDPHGAEDT
jgi:hypothetical protein